VTLSKAWAIGIGVVIALAIVMGGYELLQEHDARLKAESAQTVQEGVIQSNRVAMDKAKQDQAQTANDLKTQLAAIANQRTIIVTPQQAAIAMPSIVPNLPQPVQVQTIPATATAPASQQLVIPQADIPAFQAYKLSCDESNVRLMACSKDAISAETIQEGTASDLKVMTKERDEWEATAKGGTFWTRLKHDAVQIVITAGVAYAAGRLSK
jgi:hypothetical protein